mmetsp:Transcript_61877/g.184169  ORF Transcript_61877/g.184169 Transcript_61877/m.184169 type:complete len:221 (+) Transcript_61877:740-1402(+)
MVCGPPGVSCRTGRGGAWSPPVGAGGAMLPAAMCSEASSSSASQQSSNANRSSIRKGAGSDATGMAVTSMAAHSASKHGACTSELNVRPLVPGIAAQLHKHSSTTSRLSRLLSVCAARAGSWLGSGASGEQTNPSQATSMSCVAPVAADSRKAPDSGTSFSTLSIFSGGRAAKAGSASSPSIDPPSSKRAHARLHCCSMLRGVLESNPLSCCRSAERSCL